MSLIASPSISSSLPPLSDVIEVLQQKRLKKNQKEKEKVCLKLKLSDARLKSIWQQRELKNQEKFEAKANFVHSVASKLFQECWTKVLKEVEDWMENEAANLFNEECS